jgi:acyl-ACP thioesterase
MADDNITFEEEFKIRATEIDFEQKATLPAICNLLQEVAGNHAQQLEFDITDLHKDKLTWVLHRLCVKMDRYPDWRETITIKTWPSSGDGIRAYRDFLILDSDGNTIGKCLSYWLMMNIESRRPTRIPKKILQMAPSNINHVLPVTESDFQDIEEPERTEHYNVRKTDLDLNRHVNNVRYIEWALSTLPEESAVSEIDITFMAEATQEDSVIAEGQEGEKSSEGSNFYHQITRKADKKIVAKARSN